MLISARNWVSFESRRGHWSWMLGTASNGKPRRNRGFFVLVCCFLQVAGSPVAVEGFL
jgi:hypothetical protein